MFAGLNPTRVIIPYSLQLQIVVVVVVVVVIIIPRRKYYLSADSAHVEFVGYNLEVSHHQHACIC
jgi:hypothetical protein